MSNEDTRLHGHGGGVEYRKKPVVIEAFRLFIDDRPDWFCDKVTSNEIITHHNREHVEESGAIINTLEGKMNACYGDWIIRGVKGEIYPCKPDIFEATYEALASNPEPAEDAEVREAIDAVRVRMDTSDISHLNRLITTLRSQAGQGRVVTAEQDTHESYKMGCVHTLGKICSYLRGSHRASIGNDISDWYWREAERGGFLLAAQEPAK